MIRNSNGPEMVETPRVRGSNAVVADSTVPHASDKRQRADRKAALRDYWAAAKKHWIRRDHPEYGSPAWRALEPEDPRKLAGVLQFAEMWRKFGDEIASDLNEQLTAPPELWRYATTESCEAVVQQLLAQQQRRKEAA